MEWAHKFCLECELWIQSKKFIISIYIYRQFSSIDGIPIPYEWKKNGIFWKWLHLQAENIKGNHNGGSWCVGRGQQKSTK